MSATLTEILFQNKLRIVLNTTHNQSSPLFLPHESDKRHLLVINIIGCLPDLLSFMNRCFQLGRVLITDVWLLVRAQKHQKHLFFDGRFSVSAVVPFTPASPPPPEMFSPGQIYHTSYMYQMHTDRVSAYPPICTSCAAATRSREAPP